MKCEEKCKIELRKLTTADGEDVYELLQKMPAEENGFMNGGHGVPKEGFKAWLAREDAAARGENLPEGYVPQTIYWLYVDGTPVGYVKLRERLTEALRISGGHIGYGIAPEYRGHGYCTEMLRLVLGEARKLGIMEALVTTDPGNLASRRVAEKCGGVLVSEDAEHVRYLLPTI